ncbi:DUF5304 family protein, partial [Streptomyces roseus]|uniref:DUF5304 family protein n=1 Tax=Streptomyces roseus TaxID=66430 RepID=UPI0033F218A4
RPGRGSGPPVLSGVLRQQHVTAGVIVPVFGGVVERNPEVFDHLAAAGSELLAAYRSAVEGHERRWTRDEPAPGGTSDGPSGDRSDPRDEGGSGPTQRIDLD